MNSPHASLTPVHVGAPPLHGSLPPEGANSPWGGPAVNCASHASLTPVRFGAPPLQGSLPGAAATASAGLHAEMTLGVMGGGQLGRMFVHAAQRMGYFTAVLDPDHLSQIGRASCRERV